MMCNVQSQPVIISSNCSNTCKRDFLFRGITSVIRDTLLLDEEALYSTTDQVTAERIAQDVLKFLPPTSTITDATACIGGSAYAFYNTFAHVNAVEIDTIRFQHMQHNLAALKCSMSKIRCIHGDALQVCATLKQDAIFIDPPWGGPEYKNKLKVSLYISNRPLSDACNLLAQHTRYILLKVPQNFDSERFIRETKQQLVLVHKNVNLRKMHLLMFEAIKSKQ